MKMSAPHIFRSIMIEIFRLRKAAKNHFNCQHFAIRKNYECERVTKIFSSKERNTNREAKCNTFYEIYPILAKVNKLKYRYNRVP